MTEYTVSQKRKYLAGVLRLNPIHQSAKVIQFRNQLLGKAPKIADTSQDQEKLARLKQRANDKIDQIRNQMWRQHPAKLAETLNTIDVSKLPELKSAIDRLKLVITNHAAIQDLSQHKTHHINLANTFKRVVMLPPRESGALKEAYLRQIVESPDLKKIKKMVQAMHDEYPSVFAMESDWLAKIQNLKGRKKPVLSNGDAAESYESGIPGWLIWIGFIIVFRVVAAIMRNQ